MFRSSLIPSTAIALVAGTLCLPVRADVEITKDGKLGADNRLETRPFLINALVLDL